MDANVSPVSASAAASAQPAPEAVSALTRSNAVADRPSLRLPEPKIAEEFKVEPQQMVSDIDRIVSGMNELMSRGENTLNFAVDNRVGRTLITVTDYETGEVVRQLPLESVLRVAHSIENMKGVLFTSAA